MYIETIKTDTEIIKLSKLAFDIWHECYKDLLSTDQIDYMTNIFLSFDAIKNNINSGYVYRGVYVFDNLVGFTSSIKEDKRIFLSKLYLLKDYRGLGYSKLMMNDLLTLHDLKTMYLTVNKHNKAYEVYKHIGFKKIDECVSDIGNDYVMDDYIMEKTF